jgi:hypothetical protein
MSSLAPLGTSFRPAHLLGDVLEVFDSRGRMRRPLWPTSVNVQLLAVGRPGLDPGNGIKRSLLMVAMCLSRRACRLFFKELCCAVSVSSRDVAEI